MLHKLVNLTPHSITLRDPDGIDHIIPPSGIVARVTMEPGELENLAGIPVPVARPDSVGKVEGLPDEEPGTWYIVSSLVGQHCQQDDVLVPGTGPEDGAIRNEKGHIIAVTRLKRV